MNNYKHNVLKRVDSLTKEELFDAVAGPENRIRILRKQEAVVSIIVMGPMFTLLFLWDNPTTLRVSAGFFWVMWFITHLLWGGTINAIDRVGKRYHDIINELLEFYQQRGPLEGEEWRQ